MMERAMPSTATAAHRFRIACMTIALIAAAWACYAPRPAGAAQYAGGDTYVYRVVNGYNNESRGQVSYRVQSADAGRVVMSVLTEESGAKLASTEIYTRDGNGLRHPVVNRARAVDYEFAQAFPNYEMPLDPGKHWTGRVNAMNPATGVTRSVRVDGTVVGTERVRVPAGEFDTIKIRRTVYAGDGEYPQSQTTIAETDWFSPSLGRSVRVARVSGYVDPARGRHNQFVRGDWDIYELVSAPAAR
jgi:hypothetical protein